VPSGSQHVLKAGPVRVGFFYESKLERLRDFGIFLRIF
jgi:hypothetical protein